MRDLFFQLCFDDITCRPGLDSWIEKSNAWTYPSDHGWCKHIVSGREYDIGPGMPAPFLNKNGVPKEWKEFIESSVYLPAEESWAPIKTDFQERCRETRDCANGIGNWQGTIDRIDSKIKLN
jgi:hypothetical protein